MVKKKKKCSREYLINYSNFHMLPIDWRQDVDSIWFLLVFTRLAYCEHPTKRCDRVFFPVEWEQCLEKWSTLGVFIEALPTIIVKKSSFVFLLCIYSFFWASASDGKKKKKKQRGWSDEVAWKKCIIPSFALCHSRWYLFTLRMLHQKRCSSYSTSVHTVCH